jgi:ElaB/YqjD/DUF883 family membrane-anchored ribosome-binding protein
LIHINADGCRMPHTELAQRQPLEKNMSDTLQHTIEAGQARLAKDMRSLVRDAEELLRHAVKDAGQGYSEARERLEQSIKTAKTELEAAEQALLDGVVEAGRATDRYVRRHPWRSVGLGAGVGVLVGLLIARR